MKVHEAMSTQVRVVNPDTPLQEVARLMADIDAGSVPVGENDRLVGMVTDRDIAIRAVAAGKGPECKARDVMTSEVKYVYDDEDLNQVAQNMADQRVRRMPVVDRSKRLVGMLSIGDIASREGGRAAGEALSGIAQPGGPHSQSDGARA